MGSGAQQGHGLGMLWGPLTRLGLAVAAASTVADQASKLWLLYVFDIGARMPVRLAPFLDLVLRSVSLRQLFLRRKISA